MSHKTVFYNVPSHSNSMRVFFSVFASFFFFISPAKCCHVFFSLSLNEGKVKYMRFYMKIIKDKKEFLVFLCKMEQVHFSRLKKSGTHGEQCGAEKVLGVRSFLFHIRKS